MKSDLLERLNAWQEMVRIQTDHGVLDEAMALQADALVAAWEAMPSPYEYVSAEMDEWHCSRCERKGVGTSAWTGHITHADDCDYGKAIAALERLLEGE